jgi:hypothetical protein
MRPAVFYFRDYRLSMPRKQVEIPQQAGALRERRSELQC